MYSPECCQRTHHWYLNSLEKDNARVSFRKTFVLVPFLTLCGGSNQPKLLYFVILFHFIELYLNIREYKCQTLQSLVNITQGSQRDFRSRKDHYITRRIYGFVRTSKLKSANIFVRTRATLIGTLVFRVTSSTSFSAGYRIRSSKLILHFYGLVLGLLLLGFTSFCVSFLDVMSV